ncbi:MAG: hypothetical protein FD147_332 [Chloroflexi bacterium]|nr:MAG: hypothetical protein FD147_332 [Chloroflexota bacterium]
MDIEKKTRSGFLLVSIVLMIIFIIAVLMPIEPSDYWTYLRIGDEILSTRHIPTTEFMTYTRAGEPALFSYWLASLTLLGIYKTGGVLLTALVTGICITALYVLLWLCLRELKAGPVSASLLLLVTALMGSNNWSTRPQIFTYPLFGLTLWILVKWQLKDNRFLWYLPIAALLWVNLHGSYILLFLLLIAALIFGEGDRKRLLIVALICGAASFINPYGAQIWTNASSMIGNTLIKTFSSEWFPPANQGWQLNLFFASLLLIPIITAFTPARAKKLYWVWFLGFGWMALSSVRYVVWFSVVEALLLAELAGPWLKRFLDKRPVFPNKALNLSLGILLLGLSLAFLPGIRESWWVQAPPDFTDTTPVRAVEWLKQRPDLPGEVWSNWVASIYMTYALPERKVWITNRIEDFPEEQHLDNKRLMRAAWDWQLILDKYSVNLLLLDRKYEDPLVQAVSASPAWQEVYRDDQSLIFVR